jgi:hypothetical protein
MRTGEGSHYRHIRSGTGASIIPNPGGTTSGRLTTTNGVGATATHYFEIGGADDGITSCQIMWDDATSAATITLETTNLGVSEVAYDSLLANKWSVEPVVITGPVASAAGSFMCHIGNNGAKRNRLKVVVTANTNLDIVSYGIH